MASKKPKHSKQTLAYPNSNHPWLAWWEPISKGARQRFEKLLQDKYHNNLDEFLDCKPDLGHFKSMLMDARYHTRRVADTIVPELPDDVKEHPIPNLESIQVDVGSFCNSQTLTLRQLLIEYTGDDLKWIRLAWPHPDAPESLKELASYLASFLYSARRLGDKKIALANTMGLTTTKKKLEDAYKELCMVELTGDEEKDAERLFLEKKISLEDFKKAMYVAFSLDRTATEEINNRGGGKSLQPQTATFESSSNRKSRKTRTCGRRLSQQALDDNVKKNELIVEIRRRADKHYHSLGADGISAAYKEIEKESKQARSKWQKIVSLATRKAIMDKARHNKRYVTSQ